VSFWTGREVRDTVKSHVNYLVADTKRWEQQAGQYLDGSPYVAAWVKNAGLGFGIPYEHDGQRHEYVPDFLVRLVGGRTGSSSLKRRVRSTRRRQEAAALRWVAAVNADRSFGYWGYQLAYQPADVPHFLAEAARM
jgi:type III restriction enzyme